MPEYHDWLKRRIPLLFIYAMALLTIVVFLAVIILARVETIDPETFQPPGPLRWLWNSFIGTPAPWAVVPGAIVLLGATRLVFATWGPLDEDDELMEPLRRKLGKILGTAAYAVLSMPYNVLLAILITTLGSFTIADWLLNLYPYREGANEQVVGAANLFLQGIPGALLFTLTRGLESGKAIEEERARRRQALPNQIQNEKWLNRLPGGFYLWGAPAIMITGWILYATYGTLLWQGLGVEKPLTDFQLYLASTVAAVFIGWLGALGSSWMVQGRSIGFQMDRLSWHRLSMTTVGVAIFSLPSVIIPTPAAFVVEGLVGTSFQPTTLAIIAFIQQFGGGLMSLPATYVQARARREHGQKTE